jgi:hypothetical protein
LCVGLYADAQVLQGHSVIIRNNSAEAKETDGSGMYMWAYAEPSNVNLTASVVEDNHAYAGVEAYGGGIYLNMAALTFRDVQIRANSIDFIGSLGTVSGLGAGLYTHLKCIRGAFEGVLIEANVINGAAYRAVYSAGAGVFLRGTNGQITFKRCEVRGNTLLLRASPTTTFDSYGAGLHARGTLTLNSTLISGNVIDVVGPTPDKHLAAGAGTVV